MESHTVVAHLLEAHVLSGPHVHHPASVLGLLVHQPVAVHHVAGLAVGHAVTILDVVTILHHLMGLTTEVLPLVDLHPVLASVLFCFEEVRRRYKWFKCNPYMIKTSCVFIFFLF